MCIRDRARPVAIGNRGPIWSNRCRTGQWYKEYAALTAMPVFAMLKIAWDSLGRCSAFQRHCTAVPTQPNIKVSDAFKSAMPTNTNRKQTGMLPRIPGRLTFSPAARADRMR